MFIVHLVRMVINRLQNCIQMLPSCKFRSPKLLQKPLDLYKLNVKEFLCSLLKTGEETENKISQLVTSQARAKHLCQQTRYQEQQCIIHLPSFTRTIAKKPFPQIFYKIFWTAVLLNSKAFF